MAGFDPCRGGRGRVAVAAALQERLIGGAVVDLGAALLVGAGKVESVGDGAVAKVVQRVLFNLTTV